MHQKIDKIVLASSNQGKLKELRDILANVGIEVIPQSEFNIEDVEETGTTFIENALLKAKHASAVTGLPALADDSGLVVPALGGAPGLYSARYAQKTPESPKDHGANNAKLLAELSDHDDRQAMFVCVMALCFSASHPLPLIAQGVWHGSIATEPYGEGGFGYDPLFYVPTHGVSAAELAKAEKNAISHRGQALQSLLSQLQGA